MAIAFTQHLRPDGRGRIIHIERPSEIEAMAWRLESEGCRLEAEVLSTGEVSFTVEDETAIDDFVTLAHEIVPNGPDVPAAVDRLIKTAAEKLYS